VKGGYSLIQFASSRGQGLCLEAAELALALQAAGVRVCVLTIPGEQFAGTFELLRANMQVRICDQLDGNWLSTNRRQVQFLVEVARENGLRGPVVFHGWGILHALLIKRAILVLGKLERGIISRSVIIPAFLHHGSWYESAAYLVAARILRWAADAVIAQCWDMERKLSHYGVPKYKIYTIYPGRDIESFRKKARLPLPPEFHPDNLTSVNGQPLSKAIPKVAYLGLYIARKDHLTLFRAIRYLKQLGRPVGCICLGWGPQREKLIDLVHELDIADLVVLAGRLDQNFVPAFISEMDLVVSASRAETFGHTLIEPLILGKPVVTTRVGVAFELESVQGAKVVNPGDWRGLAESIAWVLDHPVEVANMVKRGQEFVLANYDINIVAHRFANLYESLIARE